MSPDGAIGLPKRLCPMCRTAPLVYSGESHGYQCSDPTCKGHRGVKVSELDDDALYDGVFDDDRGSDEEFEDFDSAGDTDD